MAADPNSISDDTISEMIMSALRMGEVSTKTTTLPPDDQRDYIQVNTQRLNKEQTIRIYQIAFSQLADPIRVFRSQQSTTMSVVLDRIDDDIIAQMYALMVTILENGMAIKGKQHA